MNDESEHSLCIYTHVASSVEHSPFNPPTVHRTPEAGHMHVQSSRPCASLLAIGVVLATPSPRGRECDLADATGQAQCQEALPCLAITGMRACVRAGLSLVVDDDVGVPGYQLLSQVREPASEERRASDG